MSPIVLRVQGYRIGWWSNEGSEPPHVHVLKGGAVSKWWLLDLSESYSYGFNPAERRTIAHILAVHRQLLLREWYERNTK